VNERLKLAPGGPFPGDTSTTADVLLAVHRSYLKALAPVRGVIHAMAHITGGGLPGNLDRSLPPTLDAAVDTTSWEVPNVFIAGGAVFPSLSGHNPTETMWALAFWSAEAIVKNQVSLSDAADEAFAALRARVAREAGWDFLSQLQNAFVGINDPLPPGYAYNDWLYTGRGFAISRAAFQAGWVAVVREDFGLQTFWRVLVRTAAQDGSQGEPLRWRPWDFDSRYAGDPAAYDRGGTEQQNPPAGYYIDFTALAADYGFDRLPALSNWRSFYPGSRFDEFALRENMDWVTAMRQLYPDSAIATPTPYQTPTPTPTSSPKSRSRPPRTPAPSSKPSPASPCSASPPRAAPSTPAWTKSARRSTSSRRANSSWPPTGNFRWTPL